MTMKTIKWNNNFLLAGLLFLVSLFSVGGVLVSCSESEKIVTQIEEKIVYVDGKIGRASCRERVSSPV